MISQVYPGWLNLGTLCKQSLSPPAAAVHWVSLLISLLQGSVLVLGLAPSVCQRSDEGLEHFTIGP